MYVCPIKKSNIYIYIFIWKEKRKKRKIIEIFFYKIIKNLNERKDKKKSSSYSYCWKMRIRHVMHFVLQFSPTLPSGPSRSSSHNVHVYICPLPAYFFQGLSLALRSHDQFKASHWSTLLPYFPTYPHQPHPPVNQVYIFNQVDQVNRVNCIGQEIRCLLYEGFKRIVL